MAKQRSDSSSRTTVSGLISKTLAAFANRLVLLNALSSQGALWRAMRIPFPRVLARFFRWWSRGWAGQILGLGWSFATFKFGLRDQLDPADVGDEWSTFRDGSIKRQYPKKPGD